MRRSTTYKILLILSKAFLLIVAFCALFSEWICNQRPLITSFNNTWHITAYAFSNSFTGVTILSAPIPYSPNTQDPRAVHSVSPVSGCKYQHYMGTDELGHDILSHIVYGCRTACIVGIIAVTIACIIGVIIGLCAGFFGNSYLHVYNYMVYACIISIVPVWFYSWHIRQIYLFESFSHSTFSGLTSLTVSLFIAIFIVLILYFTFRLILTALQLKKLITIPLDSFISRGMDIFISLPLFYVALLLFTQIKTVTTVHIALLIGFTGWVGFARLTRTEVLRLRYQPFIEASITEGTSVFRLMIKHILPNVLSPIIVAIVFGIANAILAESAFSVIGLMPADHVSWGTLLSDARHTPEVWWLSVFPGAMLTILMISLYAMGNAYKKAKFENEPLW